VPEDSNGVTEVQRKGAGTSAQEPRSAEGEVSLTKQQTLDQLHTAYSKFCAWCRDEESEYMSSALENEIREAMLAAARAIDKLPDEPRAHRVDPKDAPVVFFGTNVPYK
jgi:hypothetical protein